MYLCQKSTINSTLAVFDTLDSQKAIEKSFFEKKCIHIKGFVGSGFSFRIAAAYQKQEHNLLLVLDNAEQAAYYLNDFERLLSPEDVLYFPASYRQPYAQETTDNANVLLRSEVLKKISGAKKPRIVVTYPQAVFEKIISQHTLKRITFKVIKNTTLSLSFINESLFEMNFERVDFVTGPGEFAVRGGIIDVFSFAYQHPYRIEFFDDTVERLCSFDVETQRSITSFDSIELLPDTSNNDFTDKRKTILDFFPTQSSFIFFNFDKTTDRLETLYDKAIETFSTLQATTQYPPEILFVNKEEWVRDSKGKSVLVLERTNQLSINQLIHIKQSPQPAFNKQFDLLITHLNNNHNDGFENTLFCSNKQQTKRFHDIFQELEKTVHYKTKEVSIFEGFEDLEAKWACFSDHQIFERYHKYKLKSDLTRKQALNLKELTQMEVGDYVTHIDHGIGTFGGLQRIEVEDKWQEAIKLIYGERDILYLSIHSLHKISKYNGKDGSVPKIYKLGSKAWKILKQKTKTKVKEIAFNLIELYAKRRQKIGFSFDPDSYLQWELEASFMYEDTPDQGKATQAVKADMESQQPMDRLVCGDVGFGKTEVAIRAAFKAADNSKQVVILVPTTILAFQHYKTFSNRLKELPVRVDYINRFRSSKDRTQILQDLEAGKIDILIGTHQLVNKNVVFKDLGLLIVDEEQKFGVSVKEKIRSIKENVDVLTLTATPIPRTLQYSLMSARDLSVINTPPQNRFPIDSNVISFKEEIIAEAINFEMQRGGQVFFVHNRIENIQAIAALILRLVPNADIAIVHGKIEGKKLEKTMLDFINGKFDVLISTTIIESGLDVPNANTIFINNAQNFGLSDLHQMRGRVGRSNKKAFCYFITSPYSSMTKEARKRIEAIEQHTELGSGFLIAMKDLEIRGAGDLLGAEQSGFINDIGFETYQKILKEAVEELKTKDFQNLFEEDLEIKNNIQIDTDLEILFPDDYINNIKERLRLYKLLSEINTDKELKEFENNLKDRFGEIPFQTVDLLKTVEIKWMGIELGFEKIILKNDKMICQFISDKEDSYYSSGNFQKILTSIHQNKNMCEVKEKKKNDKVVLLAIFKKIYSINEAIEKLKVF